MTETGYANGLPRRAATAAELVRGVVQDVLEEGISRYSDNNLEVRELLSVNTKLVDPLNRLMRSPGQPQIFNPGLAVARFFYLLSGSHDLETIIFYSPAAAKFSDDGLTMPGGAHGFRLFHPISSVNQFDGVRAALSEYPERNRAAVSFYHPSDCGSPTADLTCVMGAMFTRKNGRLQTLVNMRANDALRLLWHDMFEFSMLGEYIARSGGFELGGYYHSSFVMMLIGRSALESAELVIAERESAPAMAPMPAVTRQTRVHLVGREREIRAAVAGLPFARFGDVLSELADQEEPYWADLLTSLALQGRMVHREPLDAAAELEKLSVPADFVVAEETRRNSLKLASARIMATTPGAPG